MKKQMAKLLGWGKALLINFLFLILIAHLSRGETWLGSLQLAAAVIGIFLLRLFSRQAPLRVGRLSLNLGRKMMCYYFAVTFLTQLLHGIPYQVYHHSDNEGFWRADFKSIFYDLPADIMWGRLLLLLAIILMVFGVLFWVAGYVPDRFLQAVADTKDAPVAEVPST